MVLRLGLFSTPTASTNETDRWDSDDISVDGISFIANCRSQFDYIIQRHTLQELLRRLKRKLASPAQPEPARS